MLPLLTFAELDEAPAVMNVVAFLQGRGWIYPRIGKTSAIYGGATA
jgi:hypothetical protein